MYNFGAGLVRKKQKRRTCYECGTPGHLSSACPNKKNIADGNDAILHQEIQQEDSDKIREEEQVVDTQGGKVPCHLIYRHKKAGGLV